jgi:protein-disulfide isomerase
MRIVEQFYALPVVGDPSLISPFWTARSTERWEDAPIRIVEYADLLCPDCVFLFEQLEILAEEYAGKINIAFQFFPLDGACNDVVEKDLHPGACELSWIAAHDPDRFLEIHDEVFQNNRKARDPAWRRELASRYGVEGALEDPATRDLVSRIIGTGREYEKTHERYSHGIRSTPTMVINGRMVIGTFPIDTMRAIFDALLAEQSRDERFMENWERRGG